jgi:Xaa-Pro aminopeptidase
MARVVSTFLRERRLRKVLVPSNFPLGLARELRDLKIKVKVKEGTFFPERELKTAEEVKKISAALMMAEVGLAEGIQALKTAKVAKHGRLMYHHLPLTAEKLRSIIDIAVIQAGGIASHTIVASGKQGCDPHERGFGPLRANQPIILDVFPRSQKTGYFGDITRTVVKGRAAEGVRKLYHAVARAQDLAFDLITGDKPGVEIHQAVEQLFAAQGYKTSKRKGRMEGFFHGTGHGLGLEVHEATRLSPTSSDILKPGHIVTVEPGLYYPGLGGIRLEDVVLVTTTKPRNLTKFEKVLEV